MYKECQQLAKDAAIYFIKNLYLEGNLPKGFVVLPRHQEALVGYLVKAWEAGREEERNKNNEFKEKITQLFEEMDEM